MRADFDVESPEFASRMFVGFVRLGNGDDVPSPPRSVQPDILDWVVRSKAGHVIW